MACDWLLVDGSSSIFRAFYAVPASVRAPDGRQVNAVRGFLETLARLITTRRPRRLAVASDIDWRPAWRVELLPSYKLHRVPEPIPPALEPQMPVIEELLSAIGVDMQGVADYEAEDVIASWTARIDGTVEIASGDRDLFALVESDRIVVLYPEKGGLAVVDEAEVSRRYGVPGRRYADFAVLRGDPSDGLPGLKGVGAVSAAQLIKRHGGIEAMLRDTSVGELQREYLTKAMQVVQPVRHLEVSLPPGRREQYPEDANATDALAEQHGVRNAVGHLVTALGSMVSDA
ncbi:MAG: flap endonuclease [Candidatus Dormibacteraeota bacterium]|nr:flap endonuclease [Candidatus Dormibacteraeota bacterium]